MKKEADPWAGVKFYKNCSHPLASYYTRSGRRYTGLDKEDAERIGKELGYDLRPESSFWDTFDIKVGSEKEIVILDTTDPWQELQYKFAKNHKNVSKSLKDITPGTEYVLLQESLEASESNVKARQFRKASAEFDKLSPDQMRKALRLYGINSLSSNNEIVESKLFLLVQEDPKKFLDIWVNNSNREIQYLIEEAVSKNILRRTNTIYKYGTDVIGYSLFEAIEYLNNPVNRDLRMSILAQLDGKTAFTNEKFVEVEDKEANDQSIVEESHSKSIKSNKK